MSIDFFNPNCQEPERTDAEFGLCDELPASVAYSDTSNPENWIATVNNRHQLKVRFTPVDKCLIQDHEYPERGRCDGLLTSERHIYFIELKDQKAKWISHALDQLESTVKFYLESHDFDEFVHKKAFACNKQHGRFQEIDNETNLRFFRTYGVRLDLQAEVLVV